MLRKQSRLSVNRAVWSGMAWVNGPVFVLLFLPLWTFGSLVKRGVIDREYNWVGLLVFLASFCIAWLWWSFMVPRWRLWAYRRVASVPALKAQAVSSGLTWPDGHWFNRTEIKSKAHARREAEFDPPYRIVPADSDDFEYVRNLSRRNMEPYYTALGWKWDPTLFVVSWPTTENYAIEEHDRMIGALRLRPEADAIYISDLQIEPAAQGRGAGTFALRFAERLARERGLPRLRLRVFLGSAAARLYERSGFRKVADEPGKQLYERVL